MRHNQSEVSIKILQQRVVSVVIDRFEVFHRRVGVIYQVKVLAILVSPNVVAEEEDLAVVRTLIDNVVFIDLLWLGVLFCHLENVLDAAIHERLDSHIGQCWHR